mmetsp:Transcript_8960/g.27206  ORF Transcript_8960/g.27206 Transcript_8960/m.27206 type:complete len:240 (+) Transcript_8960:824-1543(+)
MRCQLQARLPPGCGPGPAERQARAANARRPGRIAASCSNASCGLSSTKGIRLLHDGFTLERLGHPAAADRGVWGLLCSWRCRRCGPHTSLRHSPFGSNGGPGRGACRSAADLQRGRGGTRISAALATKCSIVSQPFADLHPFRPHGGLPVKIVKRRLADAVSYGVPSGLCLVLHPQGAREVTGMPPCRRRNWLGSRAAPRLLLQPCGRSAGVRRHADARGIVLPPAVVGPVPWAQSACG